MDRRGLTTWALYWPTHHAGRIGDAALGVRLLTAADDIEARAIAAELDRLNRVRQQIEIERWRKPKRKRLLARPGGAGRGGCRRGRTMAAGSSACLRRA